MKNKNQKAVCVYAGPEIMAKIHHSSDKPEKTEEQTFCPNCGRKAEKGDQYCAECGTVLMHSDPDALVTPPPFPTTPPAPAATYAGPDFYNGNGFGIPVAPPEKAPYPQNFASVDEEPLDVYAGPPVDFDE